MKEKYKGDIYIEDGGNTLLSLFSEELRKNKNFMAFNQLYDPFPSLDNGYNFIFFAPGAPLMALYRVDTNMFDNTGMMNGNDISEDIRFAAKDIIEICNNLQITDESIDKPREEGAFYTKSEGSRYDGRGRICYSPSHNHNHMSMGSIVLIMNHVKKRMGLSKLDTVLEFYDKGLVDKYFNYQYLD